MQNLQGHRPSRTRIGEPCCSSSGEYRGIPLPESDVFLPSSWTCPGDQNQMPTTTSTGPVLLNVQDHQLHSESLPYGAASPSIPEGEFSHLKEETHFSSLYPQSCSFGHFLTEGEGRNIDRLGSESTLLQTAHRSACRFNVKTCRYSREKPLNPPPKPDLNAELILV